MWGHYEVNDGQNGKKNGNLMESLELQKRKNVSM